ncbi:MAG: histone deacetylase [Anaerolineae bacterium]|jgi:acetoin utilization deacetylase AcuC-like enzyme|nr:histone deacetylase [Anaerolineae bacterium]
MTIFYATHPRCTAHRLPGEYHPERPERLEAVWALLQETGLHARLNAINPLPATRAQMEAVHSEDHLNTLAWIAGQERPVKIGYDSYAVPESYDIARLAAGAVAQTVAAVLTTPGSRGLAAVRPPGHHATPDTPMGFCLLNNIALGAAHARQQHGLQRVLIVDYDVHHGNGTQDIFYEEAGVLFISVHQHGRMFYPGTGSLNETGRGAGRGYTLNIPLPASVGDAGYAAVFDRIIAPAARRYAPELILVSAGFDGHFVDPLASMRLSLAGYDRLARQLIRLAEELCGGRIVFVMEGGYDLTALSHGMANIARALLGEADYSDPLGMPGGTEPDISPVLAQVQQQHGL